MSGLRLFTGVDYVTNVVCWAGNHFTTMTDSVYVLLHEPWWPFILFLSNSVGAALFLIVQWNVQSGQSSFFAATKWSCHQRMSFIDWQWVGGGGRGVDWGGLEWNAFTGRGSRPCIDPLYLPLYRNTGHCPQTVTQRYFISAKGKNPTNLKTYLSQNLEKKNLPWL